MNVPSSDSAAIRQIIRTLKANGFSVVSFDNGEEEIPVTNEKAAIKEIMEVDAGHLYFVNDNKNYGYVYFVLGNEPFEVACDWTTNLTGLDELTDSWL